MPSEESTAENRQSRTALAGYEPREGNDEFATPPKIWRPLGRAVGGWDLDPCSGAEHTPIAPDRFTADDDGLSKPWYGNVFCNPPWSSNGNGSAKEEWLTKVRVEANRDDVDTIVVLLPVDTSSHWFHDHQLQAEAICFIGPGRISFVGENRNPSFQTTLSAFGDVPDRLLEAMDRYGVVVQDVYKPTTQMTLEAEL
jgi:hypothetical protein